MASLSLPLFNIDAAAFCFSLLSFVFLVVRYMKETSSCMHAVPMMKRGGGYALSSLEQ